MLQDLRYGARMLLKNPGFTLVVALSLALGIGANTVVFSLLDAVLLKMLPVKEPEQLVLIQWLSGDKPIWNSITAEGSFERDEATGLQNGTSFSYPAYEHLRANNRSLAETFAFASTGVRVSVDGQGQNARGQFVVGNYFAGLGLPAFLGRTLTDDDDKAGAEPAAVISYKYWQKRFGGDPAVVGRTVYINDIAFTIAGVTPPEFYGTSNVGHVIDISVPLATFSKIRPKDGNDLSNPRHWWLNIMGRLKPGVSRLQAQAELNLAIRQHVAEVQKSISEKRDVPQIVLASGSQGLMQARRKFSQPLRVLMMIVGMVLAVASLNVATLLLSRAARRRKEIAVRLAAGASRLRLIRQLLTESLLLAALGGGLGLILAYGGKDVLVALRPLGYWSTLPDLKIDQRVLGFTAAVTILTGILFGLAPALSATRINLFSALKEGSSQTGFSRSRLSKWLVVAQIAMSLVLLVDAGLLVRTLRNLTHDVGFNRENLLLFEVNPSVLGYQGLRLANLYQQLYERLEATTGVRSVTVGSRMLGGTSSTSFCVPGYTPQPQEKMMIYKLSVGANYFETMGMPILQGRGITRQDIETIISAIATRQNTGGKPSKGYVEPRQVAVINQTAARKYFPTVDPVGRYFSYDTECKSSVIEVVGVVRDARYGRLREEIQPTIYVPYLRASGPPSSESFTVRTDGEPAAMTASIQMAVRALEPRLSLDDLKTQTEQITELALQERLFAILSSFFSLLALTLVAIGLYGVMSYAVARRTHEIGVRMALGAERGDVLRLVMRETLWLAFAGVALGIPAALFAARWIASQLFGVAPYDPLTITLGALLMIAVMATAGYMPARKAAEVDPLVALRCE